MIGMDSDHAAGTRSNGRIERSLSRRCESALLDRSDLARCGTLELAGGAIDGGFQFLAGVVRCSWPDRSWRYHRGSRGSYPRAGARSSAVPQRSAPAPGASARRSCACIRAREILPSIAPSRDPLAEADQVRSASSIAGSSCSADEPPGPGFLSVLPGIRSSSHRCRHREVRAACARRARPSLCAPIPPARNHDSPA
jgi:hypothetical protein